MKTIRLFGLIFSFLLLIQHTASAGTLTASRGVEKLVNEHKSSGKSYAKLITGFHAGQFRDYREWVRFLKKLTKTESVTEEPDFPELCYLIGSMLNGAPELPRCLLFPLYYA